MCQVFYVDRVIFRDLEPVKRHFPAFKGWTLELLKQRQNYEKKFAASGEGLIIRQRQEKIEEVRNRTFYFIFN